VLSPRDQLCGEDVKQGRHAAGISATSLPSELVYNCTPFGSVAARYRPSAKVQIGALCSVLDKPQPNRSSPILTELFPAVVNKPAFDSALKNLISPES